MKHYKDFTKKRQYNAFAEQLKNICEVQCIGTVGDYDLFSHTINPAAERAVCFIAGLHGDEEAGPLGVLKFLESNVYVPKHKKVILIPLANPSGYDAGTRVNDENDDINRHFLDEELKKECKCICDCLDANKIDMLVTLHEDPDMKDFYLYYTHNKGLAEDLRELASRYFPIFGKSERTPIEGEELELYNDKIIDGLIPLPHTKRGTIEDRMLGMGIPYITTETPGKAALHRRTDFTKNAMKLILHHI